MDIATSILSLNSNSEDMCSNANQLCAENYRDGGAIIWVFDDLSELSTRDIRYAIRGNNYVTVG